MWQVFLNKLKIKIKIKIYTRSLNITTEKKKLINSVRNNFIYLFIYNNLKCKLHALNSIFF